MLAQLILTQVPMPLAAGTRLGAYEVLAQIGAGGMGEVYKARDPKLDRYVAIKVLPPALAANPDFLARFEREAKAVAALNHPNVLGIHDLGQEGDLHYAVMELLEGETLRHKLKAGALAPKKALEIAAQIAEGLAAAHAKGIIHRDIKPDNLWLTREGRVKVLDFGLAKQLPDWLPAGGNLSEIITKKSGEAPVAPGPGNTEAGLMLGTVGYMAPEQVRGKPADSRADVFSFGAVLYELLTGRRAFEGDSAVQVLSAILEEDPAAFPVSGAPIPPALEQLVFHCLEKESGNRFQSMKDVAYTLANLSLSGSGPRVAVGGLQRRTWPLVGLGAGAVLLVGFALAVANRLHVGLPPPPPTFQRLSFAPGSVDSAFFGPDGKTVYFSARVAGAKPEIFTLHPGDEGPRALGITDARLLGVSPGNELFLLRSPRLKSGGVYAGLLAQAPTGGGGALKDLMNEIQGAAWDAQGLAALLILTNQGRYRLEFPVGKTVFEGEVSSNILSHLRLSPDGQRLALVAGDTTSRTEIQTFDRRGAPRTLYTKLGDVTGRSLTGLAWGPGGEIWFTELQGEQTALWALADGGRQRLLWRGPGSFELMDANPEGRVLMAAHQARRGVLVQRAGEAQARDLSIGSGTQVYGMSEDGRHMLLLESPNQDGGSDQDRAFLRPVDGGPALGLAKGSPRTLTPDGGWVHLYLQGQDARKLDPILAGAIRAAGLDPVAVLEAKSPKACLLFIPTGLDRPWAVALPPDFKDVDHARLLPDGQHLVFVGDFKKETNWFLLDRRGGEPRALTTEGYGRIFAGLVPVSPDGRRFITSRNGRDWVTVPIPPVQGQAPQPLKGILPGERPLRWTADGRGLYVRPELSVLPVTLTRVDPVTGTRTLVQTLAPPDLAGHIQTRRVFLSGDARTFAYDFDRRLSELYLVEGVK